MATDKEYCQLFIRYLLEENILVDNKVDKEHVRTIYQDSFKPNNKKKNFPFSTMRLTLENLGFIKYDKQSLIFKRSVLEHLKTYQCSELNITEDLTLPSKHSSTVITNRTSNVNGTNSTLATTELSLLSITESMPAINQIFNINSTNSKPIGNTALVPKAMQNSNSNLNTTAHFKCALCGIQFEDENSYQIHLKTDRHILLNKYVKNPKSLTNAVLNLHIEVEDNQSDMEEVFMIRTNEVKEISLKLVNNSGKDYYVKEVVEITPNRAVTIRKSNGPFLKNGTQLIFKLCVYFVDIEYAFYPLVFRLKESERGKITDLLKELVFHAHANVIEGLHARDPYKRIRPTQVAPIRGVVRGQHMKRTEKDFHPAIILQQYNLSDDLLQLFNHSLNDYDDMTRQQMLMVKDIRNLLYNYKFKFDRKLNENNYYEMLRLLLFLEEYQMKIDIQKYALEDGKLLKVSGFHKNCLELKVQGLAEHRPSLLRGDSVFVLEDQNSAVKYEGIVHQIQHDSVILGFSNKFMNQIHVDNKKYNILFGFNRVPVRAEHQAINLIREHRAISILCKDNMQTRPLKNHEFLWFNKNISNNLQQQQAVKHIVSQTSRPMPYLIFGPPGTGKTVTIVEAVLQIWKLLPTKHLLVCTPSNNAADEVTKRLIRIVPKRDLIRYIAPSYPYDLVYSEVKPFVNYRDGDYYHPANTTLSTYRIVVTTLVNASRLVNGGTLKGHFEYVFIDECGQATESETLIPIAGILTHASTKGAINGQIVLAGDPKQLGPIIHSSQAVEYGFSISMLERLMQNNSAYQKDAKGKFNEAALTKLIQSYRSHPDILTVPNVLFYENELVSAADVAMTHIAVGWDHLPNPQFPVLFHGVVGKDEREQNSPSFFNVQEIDVILGYLTLLIGTKLQGIKISEEHIGIIAPYRKQVYKLQQACNKRDYGEKLFIGSVEQFQGQERLIIIVTTVRSRHEYIKYDAKFHLGFLSNPKRFNVAVTRAKALLIVVGNPKVLILDSHWRTLIKHCKDNRSVRGASFDLELPVSELTANLDHLEINDTNLLNNEDGPNFARGRI